MEALKIRPCDIITSRHPEYQRTGIVLPTAEKPSIPPAFLQAFNNQLRQELGVKPDVRLTDVQTEFARLRSGVYLDAIEKGVPILEQKLQTTPLVVSHPNNRLGNYSYEFRDGKYHWQLSALSTSLLDQLFFKKNVLDANLPTGGSSDVSDDYYLAVEALRVGLAAQENETRKLNHSAGKLKQAMSIPAFNLIASACGVKRRIDLYRAGYNELNDFPASPNPLETDAQTTQRVYFAEKKDLFRSLANSSSKLTETVGSVNAINQLFRCTGNPLDKSNFDRFLTSLGLMIWAHQTNIPNARYTDPAIINEDLPRITSILDSSQDIPIPEILKIIRAYQSFFATNGVDKVSGNELLRSAMAKVVVLNQKNNLTGIDFALDPVRAKYTSDSPKPETNSEDAGWEKFQREILSSRTFSFSSISLSLRQKILPKVIQGVEKEKGADKLFLAIINRLGLTYSPQNQSFRTGKIDNFTRLTVLRETATQLEQDNQTVLNILRYNILESQLPILEPKKREPVSNLQPFTWQNERELRAMIISQARATGKKIIYEQIKSPLSSPEEAARRAEQILLTSYVPFVDAGYAERYGFLKSQGVDMSACPEPGRRPFRELTLAHLKKLQNQIAEFERITMIPTPREFIARVISDTIQVFNIEDIGYLLERQRHLKEG